MLLTFLWENALQIQIDSINGPLEHGSLKLGTDYVGKKHIGFGGEYIVSMFGRAQRHFVTSNAEISMGPICWG